MAKMAVVGCEASGKTVFMAALTDQYRPNPGQPDRLCLVPENAAANSFGAFLRRQMRSLRIWPPATNPGRTVEMAWTLRQEGNVLAEVNMLEFGGETFRAAFRENGDTETQQEAVGNLMTYLGECGFFVILVSIKELLRDPGQMSMEEFERDTEAMWVTRGLLEFVRTHIPGAGVVIGLTQADRFRAELERAGGADRLFNTRWPTLRAIAPSVPIVPVASVSGTDSNGNPEEGYATDGILPVMHELEKWLKTVKPEPPRESAAGRAPCPTEPQPEEAPESSPATSPAPEAAATKDKVHTTVWLVIALLSLGAIAGAYHLLFTTLRQSSPLTREAPSPTTEVPTPEPDAGRAPCPTEPQPEAPPETTPATNALPETVTPPESDAGRAPCPTEPQPEAIAETTPATNTIPETVTASAATNAVPETVASPEPPPIPKEILTFSNRYAKAISGDPKYQRWVGHQYYSGSPAVSQDHALARKFYLDAAKGGDTRAMACYAVMLENGEGGDWNVPEALQWYRKAAEGGHADAMYRMGVACWDARGTDPNQIVEANNWFRKAKAANCKLLNVDSWIKKTTYAP